MWNGGRLSNISPSSSPARASSALAVIFLCRRELLRHSHENSVSSRPLAQVFSVVFVCFDTTDSVSVISYLTGEREESVRGLLLLDLESETDMRSTRVEITVARRGYTH